MYFTGATSPGSPAVPNEDWYSVTSDLVVVLDGATVRTETGCSHGAAWYARKLGAAIIGNAASRSTPLVEVLEAAIRDVAALHDDCDLQHPGTPSAGVAIVRLDHDTIRYLVLGDVTVVLDTVDGVTAVSDQRISASAAGERREADRHPIGSEEKRAAMVAMKHAELAARNTEDGYWIAAADPAAAQQAITGVLPRSEVGQFAVLTDGAARWVDLYRAGEWDTTLRVLGKMGPEWFIEKLVRPVEGHDSRGVRYPRNKGSDDATAVFVQLLKRLADEFPPSQEALSQAHAELAERISPSRWPDPGWLDTAGL